MQSLTAPPRDHLTVAQVTALLTASNVSVDFGAERLDVNLAFQEDISDDVIGGTVARNMNATVHGTVDLAISRALRWGVDLVKPYMVLSVPGPVTVTSGGGGYNSGSYDARWNLGVYVLTTPDRTVGETPETYVVQGYDRLHLLQREVGADYTVALGTTYRAAILQAFTDAGLSGVLIDGSAADDTLPAAKSWPLVPKDETDPDQDSSPVTWLRIVNDLLRAINFRSVWVDENGVFRCEAYQEPAVRAVEFTFDVDDEHATIVGEDRTLSEDVWATPNRWVFRGKNFGTGAEGDGVYTVDESDTVNGDRLGRTLVWTSVVDYDAASQAKLVSLGDRRVAADKRVTSLLSLSTGPFPAALHNDVFQLNDAAIGSRKVQARSWRMPLDGGDVEWQLETVA